MKKINWDRIFGFVGLVVGISGLFFGIYSSKKGDKVEIIDLYYEAATKLGMQQAEPNVMEIWHERGDPNNKKVDLTDVWKKIKKIEIIDPDSEALLALKFAYITHLKDERLIDQYLDTIPDLPKSRKKWMLATIISRDKDRGDAVLKYMQEAINLEPENIEMRMINALALHSYGKNELSIDQFRQVLAIDKNNVHAINKLGHVLIESGRLDQAEKLLLPMLKRKDISSATYNVIGYLYNTKKQFENAIEYISKASEIDYTNPLYHRNLALIYRTIGNVEDATEEARLAEKYGWPVPDGGDYRIVVD